MLRRVVNQSRHLKIFPQPRKSTHPELFIKNDEVTPLITKKEYSDRRSNVMAQVFLANREYDTEHEEPLSFSKRAPHKSLIVLAGNSLQYMSNDIPYEFIQNSDFYYLTGCTQSNAVLVIETTRGRDCQSFLFLPKADDQDQVFYGEQPSLDEFGDFYGIDNVRPDTELLTFLKKSIENENQYVQIHTNQATPSNFDVQMRFLRPFLNSIRGQSNVEIHWQE